LPVPLAGVGATTRAGAMRATGTGGGAAGLTVPVAGVGPTAARDGGGGGAFIVPSGGVGAATREGAGSVLGLDAPCGSATRSAGGAGAGTLGLTGSGRGRGLSDTLAASRIARGEGGLYALFALGAPLSVDPLDVASSFEAAEEDSSACGPRFGGRAIARQVYRKARARRNAVTPSHGEALSPRHEIRS